MRKIKYTQMGVVIFCGVNSFEDEQGQEECATLKILHFALAFFPEYSGTTIRLSTLLFNLPYEILLVVPDRTIGGDVIEQREEYFNNIKVKREAMQSIPAFKRLAPMRFINTFYQRPMRLFDSAKSESFDIIHAHNSSFFANAADKLSKRTNKPFIIELHTAELDYKYGIKGYVNAFYIDRMTKRYLNSCSHVITLTESLKNWISIRYGIPEEKITVVPNGSDINKFAPKYKNNAEDLKEKLNLSDSVVMYAGFMDRINGMLDLANVIPNIIAEKPDTSFVFIGHGPEENSIIALSKRYPQVKFLPMVPYDEMPVYYQMCDAFVIPRPSTISAETVTPLKLLEAMAMEKPVLGSNVGGISEVIKHCENGYLYEKGNMESFKKTLLDVLDGDNSQIGKNARKTVAENYTWEKSAKILQKVYEDLV